MTDLDALVAEKVMGWTWDKYCQSTYGLANHWPTYSTSIADAWLVVEEMRKRECTVFIRYGEGPSQCYVKIVGNDGISDVDGTADTAPEAICKAALEANND